MEKSPPPPLPLPSVTGNPKGVGSAVADPGVVPAAALLVAANVLETCNRVKRAKYACIRSMTAGLQMTLSPKSAIARAREPGLFADDDDDDDDEEEEDKGLRQAAT